MTGGYTMKEKNIRELAKRMGLISVEDMCQYTIAQLVVKIANKVNELVGEVWRFETDVQEILKTQNENIQYLLGEGLHLEVENIFDGWVQDGTFDTLINQSALKKVNDRIDETNAQLSEIYVKTLEEFKIAIKKNNVIINLKPQTYILDSQMEIDNRENVTINGNGATIRTGNGFYFVIKGLSRNITINNLMFDGEMVTVERNNHHIWLRDCERISICGCEFDNIKYGQRIGESIDGSDGIYMRSMDSTIKRTANKDIVIRNCKFKWISRNGVSIIQGENILIDNCYFSSRRAGVDLEPNNENELIKNVVVNNCYFDGMQNHEVINQDGSSDSGTIQQHAIEVSGNKHSNMYPNFGIDNIRFKNNTIKGNPNGNLTKGIKMAWLNYGVVENNSLINCKNNETNLSDNGAISLYRFNTGYIVNNLIENYGNSKGIRCYTGSELICNGNIIKNGDGIGLHISSIPIEKMNISRCIFENCGSSLSPTVETSTGVKMENCSFISKKQIGDFIYLDNNNARNSECYICNNTFDGGGLVNYGIRTISGSVKKAIVSNNEFYNLSGNVTQLSSRESQTERLYKFTKNIAKNCSGKIRFGEYADVCHVNDNIIIDVGDGNYVFDFDKVGGLIYTNNTISNINTNTYGLLLTLGTMTRIPKIIANNSFKGCTDIANGIHTSDIEMNNIKL